VNAATVADMVLIRHAEKPEANLIFATWVKSYRGAQPVKLVPRAVYDDGQHRLIERLLKRAPVLVACNSETPEQVFAWLAYERFGPLLVVHYVYTKHVFRRMGLASRLLEQAGARGGNVQHTHVTKDGDALMASFGGVFNPYLLGGA
jgi:hypothetical protein